MRAARLIARHRTARWLVPAGVVGVAGLVAGGLVAGRAGPDPLPATTSTALLADVRSASVSGFTATMVARVSLGLPGLTGLADEEPTSMASLLTGSHTVRVWYGGPDRQRVALLGPTSESDLFRSGSDLWEWDSDTRVATHTVLPASTGGTGAPNRAPASLASLTPDELAARLLSGLDASTSVKLGDERSVADRSAYDLVLTPHEPATKIGSVHIAVDGATKLPLAVEISPRSGHAAAVDVAYTDIAFGAPTSSYFSFTPPPGAIVHTNVETPDGDSITAPDGATLRRVGSTGSGWTAVVQYRTSASQLAAIAGSSLAVLPRVKGVWGSGHLIAGSLFSVLLTDDGRVFAGAVEPAAVYASATASGPPR